MRYDRRKQENERKRTCDKVKSWPGGKEQICDYKISPHIESGDIKTAGSHPILVYAIKNSHTHQHKKRDHRHRKDSYSLEGETVGWMSATHTLKKKQCDKYRGCKPGDRQ